MRRVRLIASLVTTLFAALTPLTALPQATPPPASRIANAAAAGPVTIGRQATILAWPEEPATEFTVLRPGSSRWFCIADDATVPGNDAACGDEAWLRWYHAYLRNTAPPPVTALGVGYMLTLDVFASNTDPFATDSTATNQWHKPAPHVMLLLPAPLLATFPTIPHDGAPYVMYPDTPYAHLMVPTR